MHPNRSRARQKDTLDDAARQRIADALRQGGHCFLSPAMWEWVQAIHASGQTWFTSAELRPLMPRYDGRHRMRDKATCNRWIAAMVAGHAMVRDGWRVRLELNYDPMKDPKVVAAFDAFEAHFREVDPIIDWWCRFHGLRRGHDAEGQRNATLAYQTLTRAPQS